MSRISNAREASMLGPRLRALLAPDERPDSAALVVAASSGNRHDFESVTQTAKRFAVETVDGGDDEGVEGWRAK
jgi:hypothetical protein